MITSERTLIFVGQDEDSAVQLLKTLRARDIGGALRSAYFFEGVEPAARVIIMEDVPDFVATPIKAAFPGICQQRVYDDHAEEQKAAALAALEELAPDPYASLGEQLAEAYPTSTPKRRGRPPGSKNKATAI